MICGPDNAHAERGWRAHSVPTVPTTTTTGVYTSRVREHHESAMRDSIITVIEIKWMSLLCCISCDSCEKKV